jgi:DNA-binding SARP family transcriptional activator
MGLRREYDLSVLGGFCLRLRCAEDTITLRPSSRRLVALLAVKGSQSRVEANVRLWPDLDQKRGSSNLRTVIWRLRHDAPDILETRGDGLRLTGVSSDLATVQAWARRTVAGGEQAWPSPDHASAELLPGWGEEWLIEPREELRLLQLHSLELAAQQFLKSGRHAEACNTAFSAVAMDPLRESATRLLIEIHLREGNILDALRRFDRFRILLKQELGVPPSSAVLELVASVRRRPYRPPHMQKIMHHPDGNRRSRC